MLVERMAGIYSNNFHEGVTHLIAKSVGSKKYFVSCFGVSYRKDEGEGTEKAGVRK